MTWTVYRWDDAGAPTLTGQAGTYDLINLLDNCLVTGYGAKAAAGWTKPYTGTGKAAFRQGTGSNGRYLRVDCSASGQYPRLRGYDTMSDVDTGTNPVPTDAQISGGGYCNTSTTTTSVARAWVVFADAKRFYMWVAPDVAATGALTDTAIGKTMFFYGDFDSNVSGDTYNTALVCGNAANTSATQLMGQISAATSYSTTAGHYIAGTYAQVAGSQSMQKRVLASIMATPSTIGNVTGITYPDPVTTGMLASELALWESAGVFRGVYPAIYCPLHALPAAPGDTIAGSASGGLSTKSFILLNISYNASTAGRILVETSDTVG